MAYTNMHIIHITLGKRETQWQYQVNRMVHLLAEEQKRAGWHVDLWCIAQRCATNYGSSKNALVFRSRSGVLMEIKQHMLDNPKAIYHFHGAWSLKFLKLSNFCEKKGIRFVVTTHGEYSYAKIFSWGAITRFYFEWVEKRILHRAHAVHTMNRMEYAFLEEAVSTRKLFYLNWGFKQRKKLDHVPKNNVFTIGYIARLNESWAELEVIINAFAKFRVVYPNTEFWIVGDGSKRGEIMRFVKQNDIDGVKYMGRKYGLEKDRIIMQMHVLAYTPSAKDLALPVLEAAACSVPSIVASESNIVDWTRQLHGFHFANSKSEYDWLRAMSAAFHGYSGKRVEQSLDSMTQLLNETFCWDKLIPRYKMLYQD
jgi:glycosyltransferase involved in cell wall biosynthesis